MACEPANLVRIQYFKAILIIIIFQAKRKIIIAGALVKIKN